MKDSGLVCMGILIVATYLIYMVYEGGDGIIFGSVMAAISLLTGIKFERGQQDGKKEGL